jgi:hypothetical protein
MEGLEKIKIKRSRYDHCRFTKTKDLLNLQVEKVILTLLKCILKISNLRKKP